MVSTRHTASALFAGLLTAAATMVASQDYPNKPIRIITNQAGGGSDFIARLIGQGISGPLGQPVIIDNRAGGLIQSEIVSKAPPDGYTLLVAGGSILILPLMQKTPYDPVKDFSPITLATKEPAVLAVSPAVPVKSVKELIALAKARPGELNYGSGGTGATNHLAAELLKTMAGINIVHVAYKGSAPLLGALIAGEVQLAFPSAPSAAPHVKSGRLRALAVTTAEPSALAPGLPTVAASGVPGYESASLTLLFAPAKTPEAIIGRLNQEIVRLLKSREAKEQLFASGVESVGSSPHQLAATMKTEMDRMGKVIKEAGIKGN